LRKLFSPLLTLFFQLLYNQFAWGYNFIAQIVSLGMWFEWVNTALPFLDQKPILELGFGTGKLMNELSFRGINIVGLDKSMNMARLAKLVLRKKELFPKLVNGSAQNLPFGKNSFTRIASTFPSSYILEQDTLMEMWRVLTPGGQIVIIPTAWITGKDNWNRIFAWLFQVTRQSPSVDPSAESAYSGFYHCLQAAGFIVDRRIIELPQSKVLCILADKPLQ
jgi:ubiquinone/menaquinone biosynthesis C-methylase UbiE